MARTKANPKRNPDHDKKPARVKKDGTTCKKRRWKPGTVAMREIKLFQRGKRATDLLIPRTRFDKLINEIVQKQAQDMSSQVSQVSPKARRALRTAGEGLLTELFKECRDLVRLRGAQTVDVKDMAFAWGKMQQVQATLRAGA